MTDLHFIVGAVEGAPRTVPVAALIACFPESLCRGRIPGRTKILVVNAPQMAATRGFPLPNVQDAAVGSVVETTLVHSSGLPSIGALPMWVEPALPNPSLWESRTANLSS